MVAIKTIQVIEVETMRGDNARGTIVRRVTQYFTPDGELLAERDPMMRDIVKHLSGCENDHIRESVAAYARELAESHKRIVRR